MRWSPSIGSVTPDPGLVALLACACALLFAARVRAEATDLSPGSRELAVGGELGYYGTSQDASNLYLLVPRVAAHYAFDERWSVAADYGLIALDSVPDHGAAESVVRSGNPSLFGLLRGKLGGARYHIGLGGTVPVAGIDRAGQGRLQHAAFNYAQGLSGLWDVWLWAPSRLAVLAYGRLELEPDPEVQLELELAPSLLIPVFAAWGRDRVDAFIPTAVSVGSKKGPVAFGLRLQAVFMPTNNVDALQLALEPWLRVHIGRSFVEARYTGNVDEPLAGERGPRIWGIHLGAGGVL